MNAIVLVIPIILLRYPFMAFINQAALSRAGFFPPTEGKERVAYYIYQITTIFLLFYLIFGKIHLNTTYDYIGLFLFIIGGLLYAKSVLDFSKPQKDGLNLKGLYQYSRNPMYVSFFLYFLGCSLLIGSLIYFVVLIIFQGSVHFLILSEERWCRKNFGKAYEKYMGRVRRYF